MQIDTNLSKHTLTHNVTIIFNNTHYIRKHGVEHNLMAVKGLKTY